MKITSLQKVDRNFILNKPSKYVKHNLIYMIGVLTKVVQYRLNKSCHYDNHVKTKY